MKPLIHLLLVMACLLIAAPAVSDWSDLPGIKIRDASQKAKDRAGTETDKKVDQTVDCVFNPVECARKMKRNDTASEEKGAQPAVGAAPPRPPSADRSNAGPPAPPSARIWHIDVGGGNTREVNESQLIEMIQRGEVDRTTPVWTQSFGGEFKNVGEVPALDRYLVGNSDGRN